MTDPAAAAIDVVIEAIAEWFPSTTVRCFAGEAPATAAWDAHTDDVGCDEPFVWMRVMRRYRTKVLPNSEATSNNCDLARAIDVEIGVARCAVLDREPDWSDYAQEFTSSFADSYLVERASHTAQCRLRGDDYIAAGSDLVPFGPQGGIIGWQAILYIQFD